MSEGEGGLVEAADGAVVAQWEGDTEEGLEGEGGRVVAKDGASVAQREGDAVEGLEGEGGRKVAEDGAAAIEVQDDVVVVVGCGAWQHPLFLRGREAATCIFRHVSSGCMGCSNSVASAWGDDCLHGWPSSPLTLQSASGAKSTELGETIFFTGTIDSLLSS